MSSDPNRSADSEGTLGPDSEVSRERRSVALPSESESASERALGGADSSQASPTVDPNQAAPRKRSSIRPVRPDWRPSARPASNPPRPMVVVYSGEGDRPDRWWDDRETPSYELTLETDTPLPPDPALGSRDLRSPPTARFPQMVPPAPHATVAPPPELSPALPREGVLSSEPQVRTEAPVALSSAGYSTAGPERPVAPENAPVEAQSPLEPPRTRTGLLRRSSLRRAAVVVVGGCFGAYIAMHKSPPSASPAEASEIAVNAEPAPSDAANADSTRNPEPAPNAATARNDAAPAEVTAAAVTEPAAPAPEPADVPVSEAHAAPAASAKESAEPALAQATVAVEVVPYDAQLTVGGVVQRPPYVLSVQRGKRLVFVVARKGFVARRVAIDGSEQKLTIGLLRNRSARGVEPSPGGGESEPIEAGKDSRLRVRSGL